MSIFYQYRKRIFQPSLSTETWGFIPPKPSPLFQRFVHWVLPYVFQKLLGGLSLEVDNESLQRLDNLKGQRQLLLPNHPALWDPFAMAGLSRILQENFYYVAARELFDWLHGIPGWIMQHMGCYSVVRGTYDRASFAMTRDILSENRGPLVIFVEGEISIRNDALLPLESGILHLAFMALQDFQKEHQLNALSELPSLFVCPIAIKYIFSAKGIDRALECSLSRLEKATGLIKKGGSHYERLMRIRKLVLFETSRQFGYDLNPEEVSPEQITHLESDMIRKLEQVANLPEEPSLSYLGRVRRLRNTMDRRLKENTEDLPPYQTLLHQHQKKILKNFYWDMERMVNFIGIYDGPISPDISWERYVELLRRLEREVLGDYLLNPPRTAVMKVLAPIDLKDHYEDFVHDKRKTTEQLIHQMETDLYQAITSIHPEAEA